MFEKEMEALKDGNLSYEETMALVGTIRSEERMLAMYKKRIETTTLMKVQILVDGKVMFLDHLNAVQVGRLKEIANTMISVRYR